MPDTELERFHEDLGQTVSDVRLLRADGEKLGNALDAAGTVADGYLTFRDILKASEASVSSALTTLKLSENVAPLKVPSQLLKDVLEIIQPRIVRLKEATDKVKKIEPLLEKIEDVDRNYKDIVLPVLVGADDLLDNIFGGTTEVLDAFARLDTPDGNPILNPNAGSSRPGRNDFTNLETDVDDFLAPTDPLFDPILEAGDEYRLARGQLDALLGNLNVIDFPDLSEIFGRFLEFDDLMEVLGPIMQAVQVALQPLQPLLAAVDAVASRIVDPVVDRLKEELGVDEIFEELAGLLDPLFPFDTIFDNLIAEIDNLENFLDGFQINYYDILDFVDLAEDAYDRFEQTIQNTELAALALLEGIPMRLGDTSNETMWGLGGDEIFDAREGDDLILANTGHDIIVASAGDDTIRGGEGIDRVVFAGELAEYDFARDDETGEFIFTHTIIGPHGFNEGTEVISDVEFFDFASNTYDFDFFNDARVEPSPLIGDDTDEALFLQPGETFDGLILEDWVFDDVYYAKGEFGDDLIFGTTGDDYLRGQEGNDVIIPRTGNDAVDGGDGVDTYQVFATGPNSGHTLDLTEGISRYRGERDYLARVENILIQHDGHQNVFGDGSDNILYSGGGLDVLGGREGNDRLYGNAGKDLLVGGLGVDHIFGGSENDFIAAWNTTDEGAAELYDGEGGLDWLSYATGNVGVNLALDHISQRGGAPRIDQFETSGGGPVIIRAGDGEVDRLRADGTIIATDIARSIERFIGSNGDDTLYGVKGDGFTTTIDGGPGDDALFSWGSTFVKGGTGDDLIFAAPSPAGGSIAQTIDGDEGTDTISFEQAGDFRFVLTPGSGSNRMSAKLVAKDFIGPENTARGNSFSILNVNHYILGDNDDFFEWGELNSGSVRGGSGNDRFLTEGNFKEPDLFGDAGNDLFELRSGGNAFGGLGNDRIELYAPSDEARGDEGNDTFLVVRGDVTLAGGDGYDKLILKPNSNASINMTLNSATGFIVAGANVTLQLEDLFEEYVGAGGADTFYGSFSSDRLISLGGNDTISSRAGDDQIFGGDGNDFIDGGAGDDQLNGGAGNDTLSGGSGNDTAIYSFAQANGPEGEIEASIFQAAVVDLEAGFGGRGAEVDTLVVIENVIGTHLGDSLTGNGADNTLIGGEGADTLVGGGGDDFLLAGTAETGVERLLGGDGADRVVVGTDRFSADGGDDFDTLDFSFSTDPFLGGGRTLQVEIDLQARTYTRELEVAHLVWDDDNSTGERVFDGQSYKPEAILRSDVNFARSANDLNLQLPEIEENIAAGEERASLADVPSLAISTATTLRTDNGQSDFTNIEGVIGTSGDDIIRGTDGANDLRGAAGDDLLEARGGLDTLDGGEGTDTGILSGVRADQTIIFQDFGDGFDTFIRDRETPGNETLLRGVEVIEFDDSAGSGVLDLRQFGAMGSLPEADLKAFVELYIAYFNRAPDALGLNFWGSAFANGLTLPEIAAYFIDQEETRATYPEGSTNLDFASAVYGNVLGRLPDQGGLDFWTGVLDRGDVSRDQFILQVLAGAKADPPPDASADFVQQQEADREYLSNKVDIGAHFSIVRGISNVDYARQVMNAFDGSEPSINDAVTLADDFYDSVAVAEDGELLIQVVGTFDPPFDL